jgi:hypothetical protein
VGEKRPVSMDQECGVGGLGRDAEMPCYPVGERDAITVIDGPWDSFLVVRRVDLPSDDELSVVMETLGGAPGFPGFADGGEEQGGDD